MSVQPGDDVLRLRIVALVVAGFIALLWIIHAVQVVTGWDPAPLGVRPGRSDGLIGVITAPLVHGSWSHLASNTPALLVLGIALIYGTPGAARFALPIIWLTSGRAVWLFARQAVHIGASGLTYGMLFFVFIIGILRRDRRSIALAIIVFFLYGSMIWGIFPLAPGISFEYHFFGALAGSVCAFILRHRDPLPTRRRYDWEDDEPIDGTQDRRDDLFFDRPGPDDERRF